MHTWYTYPVSIDHGGGGRIDGGADVDPAGDAGDPGAGADVRLPAAGGVRAADGGDLAAQHRAGLHDPDPARARRTGRDRRTTRVPTTGRADRRATRTSVYRATEAGRGEVSEWFATPVPRTQPARDELAIKLAIAVTAARRRRRHDHPAPAQRHHGLAAGLHPAQAHGPRRAARRPADLAWSLVLDSLVFDAEAEVRWLDHCEARLRRAATERERRTPRPAPAATARTEGGRPMNAVLHLAAVTRDPRRGRHRGPRAARRHLPRPPRRARRRDGAVRLRQVDPADPGRRPRRPDRPARSGSRAPTSASLDNAGRARMRRTSVGYVFQDFNLIPALTAAENVALPARARRREGPASRAGSRSPRWRRSASSTSPTASPTRCRAASSSGSRSPARSSASAG